MILSGIDIGTNSIRLLIAETGCDSFQSIHSERRVARLGEQLAGTGMLSPAAWNRALQTLIGFKKSMDRHSVHASVAVGTSALRNAGNSTSFIAEVLERTGIAIRVITGEEEARLTLRGVLGGVKALVDIERENTVVIDVGGGSTEIIPAGQESGTREISLPLGAVYLTERFLKNDPPEQNELETIRNQIRKEVSTCSVGPVKNLIGTAGTITTLASMDQKLAQYDPDRINGFLLRRDAVAGLVLKLSSSNLQERRSFEGLERGREDIILAGALVVLDIMDWFETDRMLVSDWGLREGIILDLYDKIFKKNAGKQTA